MFKTIALFFAGICVAAQASAATMESAMIREIGKQFPNSRIELQVEPRSGVSSVQLLEVTQRGEAKFRVMTQDESGASKVEELVAGFSAWVPAWVAVRRVLPGEKLAKESFTTQEINVASGMSYQYRGVILPQTEDLSKLEARQTILEGQFALTSGVQKVPDVRRGDSVRIRLISGDLNLVTQGTASEPAYIDGTVRVTASKTKKELVGKLTQDGTVEVTL